MSANLITHIGEYEVIGVLGQGGMGVVYKARDPRIGREVAIKMITGGFAENPDARERFYREAKAVGNLEHPNIVVVYASGEQGDSPYLVMQYLEGQALDKIIAGKMEISIVKKLEIIKQVCDALNYAHSKGVIHRDIKPGNVIVQPDWNIKLVDFGIAKLGDKSSTKTGQIIGTINYMPPEQLNSIPVDNRGDIFATGVMFYELLTGKLPFEAADLTGVIVKILKDPHPPLSKFLDSYPPELDDILEKALAKDRDSRYTVAEDFAFDLSQLIDSLKKDMVSDLVEQARTSLSKMELAKAKELLADVLKVDTQHAAARQMMYEVQQLQQKQQRSEQLRHFCEGARQAIEQKQFSEAAKLIEQGLRVDKTNSDLLQLQDSLEQIKGRRDQVQKLLRLATNAEQEGELNTAQKLVEDALQLDGSDTQALMMRDSLKKSVSQGLRHKQVSELLDSARKEIAARRMTAAMELIKEAEAIDASAPEIALVKSIVNSEREQETRRKEVDRLAVEIQQALEQKQYDAACDKCDKALKKFPGEQALVQLRATAQNQRDQVQKQTVIEKQMALARKLLEQGKAEEAAKTLERLSPSIGSDPRIQDLLQTIRTKVGEQKPQRSAAAPEPKQAAPAVERDLDDATRVYSEKAAEAEIARQQAREEVARAQKPKAEPVMPQPAAAPMQAAAAAPARAPVAQAPAVAPAPAAKPPAHKPHVVTPEPASKMPMIAIIAVIAVLVIGGVGYFLMKPGGAAIKFETNPAGAVVSADGKTCTAPCELKLGSGNYKVEAKLEGYQAAQQDISVAGKPAAYSLTLNPVAPAKPLTGTLLVETNEDGADVLVDNDDKPREVTVGKKATLQLPVGKHTIRIQKFGFKPAAPQEVEIAKDTSKQLPFELTKDTTVDVSKLPDPNLIVRSRPGATVTVDKAVLGQVPQSGSFQKTTSEGKHRIEVTLNGYPSWSKTVTARKGENLAINAELEAYPPSIKTFNASPGAIDQGKSTELHWEAENATGVTIEPGVGSFGASGSQKVSPNATTTYTLTAKGEGGSKQQNILVTVNAKVEPKPEAKPAPAIFTFEPGSDTIKKGEGTKLIWNTQNADTVSIDQGIGSVSPNGKRDVKPTQTTSYVLTAKGPGGTITKTATITVEAAAVVSPPPTSTPAVSGDVAQIKQLIEVDFKGAIDLKSNAEVSRLWPAGKDKLKGLFKADAVNVSFTPRNVTANGDKGQWDGSYRLSYTEHGGAPQSKTFSTTFKVQKKGDSWFISDWTSQ